MSRVLLSSGRYIQGAGAITEIGVLAQLVLEGRPFRDIREVQDFCFSVGLPVCLQDLNLPNPSPEEIRKVAEAAVAEGETIHATWFPVTAAMVEAAIWTADALGVDYKKNREHQRAVYVADLSSG